jgi:hypothetical protein
MKPHIHAAILVICTLAPLTLKAQVSTATPQQVQEMESKLTNTQWSFTNTTDLVTTGGVTIVKEGAWLGVRFRPNGRFSSWHDNRIIHEGRWEVIAARTLHMTNGGRDGVVVNFEPNFMSFKATNEPSSGKLIGKAPDPGPFAGRWKWHGGSVFNLREDGRAFNEAPNTKPGVWKSLGPERIEINWDHGVYIDTCRLASNGKEIKGVNQHGKKWEAGRVNPTPKR